MGDRGASPPRQIMMARPSRPIRKKKAPSNFTFNSSYHRSKANKGPTNKKAKGTAKNKENEEPLYPPVPKPSIPQGNVRGLSSIGQVGQSANTSRADGGSRSTPLNQSQVVNTPTMTGQVGQSANTSRAGGSNATPLNRSQVGIRALRTMTGQVGQSANTSRAGGSNATPLTQIGVQTVSMGQVAQDEDDSSLLYGDLTPNNHQNETATFHSNDFLTSTPMFRPPTPANTEVLASLPPEVIDFMARSSLQQNRLMQIVSSLAARPSANTEEEAVDEEIDNLDFPINDFEEFKALDEKLKSKRGYKKRFIDHIQSIGGNTEKESTKIILFHIIDKDVAIRYSRRGRGKLRKLPLEKTTFYKCLKRALKLRHQGFQDRPFHDAITRFLKDAPDRKGGRANRRGRANHEENVHNEEQDESITSNEEE